MAAAGASLAPLIPSQFVIQQPISCISVKLVGQSRRWPTSKASLCSHCGAHHYNAHHTPREIGSAVLALSGIPFGIYNLQVQVERVYIVINRVGTPCYQIASPPPSCQRALGMICPVNLTGKGMSYGTQAIPATWKPPSIWNFCCWRCNRETKLLLP